MAEKYHPFQNEEISNECSGESIELHQEYKLDNSKVVIFEQSEEIDLTKTQSVTLYVGNNVRKLCSDVNYLKVEIVMFLYMFSLMVRSVTNTVLIIDKVCLVHLGRPESECSQGRIQTFILGGVVDENLKDLKIEVEKMANNYHLGQTLITMVPSVLLSLFIGSWSDKFGRKVPIIAAMIGIIIDDLGAVICSYFLMSRVEYLYITAFLPGLSGGFIGVLMTLYAYASDISSLGNRTMRYALMEMSFGMARPMGSLVGGWIYRYLSFTPVFLISACGHVLGLLWVIFVLEETRGLDNKDSWATKFRSFWSMKSLVDAFQTTVKKRPNMGREQIWALILAMSISVFAFVSTGSIGYMYAHHQYNWDNAIYSTVYTIFAVLGVFIMLIVVRLCKKYGVRDVTFGMVGSISLMAKMVCTGLAVDKYLYYLACFLGLLAGFGTLACRSKISKITPTEDLGKIFAFLSTAESILPIAATAIVSQGFNASLGFFPGLMYVVVGALAVVPLLIFVWISRLPNANHDYVSGKDGTTS